METTVKPQEDNRIEINVTIDAATVDKAVKDAYAEANQNRIKGFRQGKAPRNVLDKVYGGPEYFLVEATDEVIKASYLKAIDSQDMVALDQPDMGEVVPAEEGQDYSYSFSFAVAPAYELSSYDALAIELPPVEPTAKEIQSRVESMMSYYVEHVEVTDRASQTGDILTLDMAVTHDGEPVEAMSGESMPYELGIDAMPEDFESNFVGIKPGDAVSVDFKMPFYDSGEEGEDQDLHVEATLLKIEVRQVPEMTDEWVKDKLEYESAEHFRQLLADSLKAQKQSALPELKERRVAQAIGERLVGEPPELVTAEFAQDIYRDIFNNLQNQGITLDLFLASTNQTPESFREDVEKQAADNACQAMALDAWARHADITVSDQDIHDEFEESGAEDPEALFAQWVEVGRVSEIRQGIRRMKASRELNEAAIVTEVEPVDEDEAVAPAIAYESATGEAAEATALPDATQVAKSQASEVPVKKDDGKKAKKADGDAKASSKADKAKSAKPAPAPKSQRKTGGPKKV